MTNSFEDLFLPSRDLGSPGGQLYLYRQLRLHASRETTGPAAPILTYNSARQLAIRMGINSPEKLSAFFGNTGLGKLELDISDVRIGVTLTPHMIPETGEERGCDLERGVIDGSLELITGVPVSTRETGCWSRGNGRCTFEASLDVSSGERRYIAIAPPGANYAGFGQAGGAGSGPGRLHAWYMDMATRELSRSRRHNRPLAILYIDIDDLGNTNAGFGRGAGDQLISAIAAAISKECRTEDHLWHAGEDEFVVLLPETGEEEAAKVSERLLAGIASSGAHLDLSLKASASIGMAVYPANGDSLSTLLASARSALYLAKSLGKGRAQLARIDEAVSGAKGNLARHPGRGRARRNEVEVEEALLAAAGGGDAVMATEPGPAAAKPGPGAPADADRAGRVSVLLVVSSPLLAAGVRNILADNSTAMQIVDEISTHEGAVSALRDLRPDLVVTDVTTVTASGFAIPELIREENLPSKLAVLAGEIDQEALKLAAEFSPDGILLQSSSAEEILSALDAIYLGKRVYPEEVRLALSELEDNRRLLEELSGRETDVLKLVAEGKTNSQISEELYITVNTVRFHLANIYQKLGVGNRTEAANYYLRQDLSPPETQPRLL